MIIIDIDKAKDIAHEKRRLARAEEFKPHDEVIMKQIPGNDMAEAETARQAIRVKYEELQTQMNEAQTVEELKELLP
jgi:hypothetical protein